MPFKLTRIDLLKLMTVDIQAYDRVIMEDKLLAIILALFILYFLFIIVLLRLLSLNIDIYIITLLPRLRKSTCVCLFISFKNYTSSLKAHIPWLISSFFSYPICLYLSLILSGVRCIYFPILDHFLPYFYINSNSCSYSSLSHEPL